MESGADFLNDEDSDEDTRKAAYVSVLENILYYHIFPRGEEREVDEFASDQFAIYDFDSESNMVLEEFSEVPLLTFYDNGVIQAGCSHNQGLAGDFWPYTLYQYNKETDSYIGESQQINVPYMDLTEENVNSISEKFWEENR